MRELHGLPENRIYDFIGFLRQAAELVPLRTLMSVPIRDVNDIVVVQTAVIGEAKPQIKVLDDIALIHRLRS